MVAIGSKFNFFDIFLPKIHSKFSLLFAWSVYNYYGDLMKKYTLFSSFVLFTLLFLHSNKVNKFILPTKYTDISSEYGYRELYGSSNFHNGIDFLAPQGSEVYASSSGYISFAGFSYDGYGNTIIIAHDNNIKTLYCNVNHKISYKTICKNIIKWYNLKW